MRCGVQVLDVPCWLVREYVSSQAALPLHYHLPFKEAWLKRGQVLQSRTLCTRTYMWMRSALWLSRLCMSALLWRPAAHPAVVGGCENRRLCPKHAIAGVHARKGGCSKKDEGWCKQAMPFPPSHTPALFRR